MTRPPAATPPPTTDRKPAPAMTVLDEKHPAPAAARRAVRPALLVNVTAVLTLEEVGLAGHLDRPGRELSRGDQRALEIALALATAPRLLLLDEPTAGMSPFETRRVVGQITALARERGLTVLFSEHDMDTVFGISDEVTVMHQGRVLAHGPAAEVRANHEVMAVYLGSDA